MNEALGIAALVFATMTGALQFASASRQIQVTTEADRRLEKAYRRLSQCLFVLFGLSLLTIVFAWTTIIKGIPKIPPDMIKHAAGLIGASGFMTVCVGAFYVGCIVFALKEPPANVGD